MLGVVQAIGVFGILNTQSPRRNLMRNAAREGKGRFDRVPEDAATETADINLESESSAGMVATVAAVAAAGIAAAAFEARLQPGVALVASTHR
jgi:hypothetical protein